MYLTKEEEKMLNGGYGEVIQRNMRLLVRLGDIYNADKMIPVGSVQVAGVSYKSTGDPGLEFLQDYAKSGVKVKVPTFLNPAGIDVENWKELKFPEYFAKKQIQIMDAFRAMGITMSATCTPYLIGNLPRFREHIAWSESSAVAFANSVIGARTNREGGPSALAAAMCGVTGNYGLHLDENRRPHFVVKVSADLTESTHFSALGYHVGAIVKNKIPYFTGIKGANTDNLKALGAAMAASGAVAIYHIENITPEAYIMSGQDGKGVSGLEKIDVGPNEIKGAYQKMTTGKPGTSDLLVFGCPHASLNEIQAIAEKVKGKKLKKPLWICTSKMMKDAAINMGFNDIIEKAGGRIVADTCVVVAPVEEMGYSTTSVNSGKAACYLPGLCKQKVIFNDVDALLKENIV